MTHDEKAYLISALHHASTVGLWLVGGAEISLVQVLRSLRALDELSSAVEEEIRRRSEGEPEDDQD